MLKLEVLRSRCVQYILYRPHRTLMTIVPVLTLLIKCCCCCINTVAEVTYPSGLAIAIIILLRIENLHKGAVAQTLVFTFKNGRSIVRCKKKP
jgi:hypothetical protein